jgi:hypothetical protein
MGSSFTTTGGVAPCGSGVSAGEAGGGVAEFPTGASLCAGAGVCANATLGAAQPAAQAKKPAMSARAALAPIARTSEVVLNGITTG